VCNIVSRAILGSCIAINGNAPLLITSDPSPAFCINILLFMMWWLPIEIYFFKAEICFI